MYCSKGDNDLAKRDFFQYESDGTHNIYDLYGFLWYTMYNIVTRRRREKNGIFAIKNQIFDKIFENQEYLKYRTGGRMGGESGRQNTISNIAALSAKNGWT